MSLKTLDVLESLNTFILVARDLDENWKIPRESYYEICNALSHLVYLDGRTPEDRDKEIAKAEQHVTRANLDFYKSNIIRRYDSFRSNVDLLVRYLAVRRFEGTNIGHSYKETLKRYGEFLRDLEGKAIGTTDNGFEFYPLTEKAFESLRPSLQEWLLCENFLTAVDNERRTGAADGLLRALFTSEDRLEKIKYCTLQLKRATLRVLDLETHDKIFNHAESRGWSKKKYGEALLRTRKDDMAVESLYILFLESFGLK